MSGREGYREWKSWRGGEGGTDVVGGIERSRERERERERKSEGSQLHVDLVCM